ncbi:MAG: tRNA (cytidine(56)-2'-O)-methyltransferase [Candidatus Micrarchaeota archaeon]
MITVLRWGHRAVRDERITSHVCLVARAFGADKVVVSGENADSILASVRALGKKWGGEFAIGYEGNWAKFLRAWKKKKKGKIVHLTMYGEPLQKKISALRREKNLLVVVGSQKVPPEIYALADYNISITAQPHSEVAALAVFLDWYFRGKELDKKFAGAKVKIMPSARGKNVAEI